MLRIAVATSVLAMAGGLVAAGLVSGWLTFVYFHEPALESLLLPTSRWRVWHSQPPHFFSMVTLVAPVLLCCGLLAVAAGRGRGLEPTSCWKRLAVSHMWLLLIPLQAVLLYSSAESTQALAASIVLSPWLVCLGLAGWLSSLAALAAGSVVDSPAITKGKLALAAATFAFCAATLAILQYRALLAPHGDAGMYEEHLWNLWNGKGFRSQLDDNRLFLGEHIEVIHVLLLPIYMLAPCLPTLNICQAIAVVLGTFAVYRLATAMTLTPTCAWLLGAAYLLYFPLQYLVLEESWKTFRPETLGVPLLLFALSALERHAYKRMLLLLMLTWAAKEEYALVSACVGLSMALRRHRGPLGRQEIIGGLGIATLSLAYLWYVLTVAIPYFREGAAPHYTPYFASLGATPLAIARNLVEHPNLIVERLATLENLQFAVWMLGPLLFLPLASPVRLLAALPIFGYLMLADRAELKQPWFHFHGPLVPLLLWAAAGGITNLSRFAQPLYLSRLVVGMCLVTGVFLGRGPASWRFYDPLAGVPKWAGSDSWPYLFEPMGSFWRDVYVPTERVRAFAKAAEHIRPDDRVAATDWIRARFTHCRAAHDYPTLRGHVSIDDIDVFILDKTEGWWGRDADGPKLNPDQALMNAMNDLSYQPGRRVPIRAQGFVVVYHDPFFLVVRRASDDMFNRPPGGGREGLRPPGDGRPRQRRGPQPLQPLAANSAVGRAATAS